MRIVKKNVYYCDHCKKRSLTSLKKHEKHCTGNPNRECQLCQRETISGVIAKLKERYTLTVNVVDYNSIEPQSRDEFIVTWVGEPVTLEEIKRIADDCPNCTLAILRQCGFNKHYFPLTHQKYDYREEIFAYWQELMNADARDEFYGKSLRARWLNFDQQQK